jgi:hypothetical protein
MKKQRTTFAYGNGPGEIIRNGGNGAADDPRRFAPSRHSHGRGQRGAHAANCGRRRENWWKSAGLKFRNRSGFRAACRSQLFKEADNRRVGQIRIGAVKSCGAFPACRKTPGSTAKFSFAGSGGVSPDDTDRVFSVDRQFPEPA